MNSYTRFQSWVEEGLSIKVPSLDESGLARFTIDETLLLHILADPNPGQVDSLFLYIPLINLQGLDNNQVLETLWHVASSNMPHALPAGFRLGTEKENGFIWLCGRLDTTFMQKRDFDICLQQAISLAHAHKSALTQNLVQTTTSTVNGTIYIDSIREASNRNDMAVLLQQNTIIWG